MLKVNNVNKFPRGCSDHRDQLLCLFELKKASLALRMESRLEKMFSMWIYGMLLAVWLGEDRKCSAAVGLDLLLGLSVVRQCSLNRSFKRLFVSPRYYNLAVNLNHVDEVFSFKAQVVFYGARFPGWKEGICSKSLRNVGTSSFCRNGKNQKEVWWKNLLFSKTPLRCGIIGRRAPVERVGILHIISSLCRNGAVTSTRKVTIGTDNLSDLKTKLKPNWCILEIVVTRCQWLANMFSRWWLGKLVKAQQKSNREWCSDSSLLCSTCRRLFFSCKPPHKIVCFSIDNLAHLLK